jgi:hypothetical protein
MSKPHIPAGELCRLGRLALPLMTPEARAEAETLMGWITENAAEAESLREAAAAFEADMQPVADALVSALEAGDAEALRGLRAMLPHLLPEVTESSGFREALGRVLGEALVEGMFGERKGAA